MFENPKFWIAVAFVTLIALSYKKLSAMIVASLDSRSARISKELEEARKLREEAQAIYEDYKQKQAHYEREAQTMLDNARKDAEAFARQAAVDAKTALDERMRQAMARISVEEENALAEVRNHVVDIVMAAARDVVSQQIHTLSAEERTQLMLADIDRKIH